MWAFIIADANGAFSFAMLLVVIIGLIEGLAVFTGISLFSLFDDWFDLDGATSIEGASGFFSSLLGWLCLGRLPLLIWMVLALVSFAIAGYSCNYLSLIVTNSLLPGWLATLLALLLVPFACHYIGAPLARVFPNQISSAISVDALSGHVATITIGKATQGNPAEAVVTDAFQQKHYVMVEPDASDQVFTAGTQVILLEREGRKWTAMAYDADSLN